MKAFQPMLHPVPNFYLPFYYIRSFLNYCFSAATVFTNFKCSDICSASLLKLCSCSGACSLDGPPLLFSVHCCRCNQLALSRCSLFFAPRRRAFSTSAANLQTSSPDFSHMPGAGKPKDFREHRSQRSQLQINSEEAKELLNHCVRSTRERDFCNYVAALLMPPAAQPSVFALLAFNVELAIVRDQIKRNVGTAGIYRLQFWKDTIEAIYGNKGIIPRQPVAKALKLFAGEADPLLLKELVSARQQTLGDRPFESMSAVEEYGRSTYGTLMLLIMNSLARQHERELMLTGRSVNVVVSDITRKAVECMGASMEIITLVRSTLPMLARGIVLLPDDLMSIHGLSADAVYSKKSPDAIRLLARDMAKAADSLILESRSLRDDVPCALRPALISSGATVDHVLKTLRKCDFNLFDARLQRGFDLLAWRLWWRKTIGWY